MLLPFICEHHQQISELAHLCQVYQPSKEDAILVWKKDQQMWGFIAWRYLLDEAELLALAVRPQYRRTGIGESLLKGAMLQWQGLSRVLLEVRASNSVAQQLYQKYGFVKIATRQAYYPTVNGRENAIIMQLTMV